MTYRIPVPYSTWSQQDNLFYLAFTNFNKKEKELYKVIDKPFQACNENDVTNFSLP